MIRAAKRTPPTSASVRRKNSASTPAGAVTVTSPLRDGTVTGCASAMYATTPSVATAHACRMPM